MADSRFFEKSPPISLGKLAELSGASLVQTEEADTPIEDVAPLDSAGASHLSFLDNIKYRNAFAATKAGACIVPQKVVDLAPAGVRLLVSDNPYKAYALAAQAFYPETFPEADISAAALIHSAASVGEGCHIEAGAIVQEGAQIGAGSWIESGAVIGRNVVLGKRCRVGAGASVSHALIGNAVRLYPGVRVGQDGFGFAIDPAGHVKVPQLGRVIIEDHVEIGANSCIDRGSGPDTSIGAGTWIDNQVQIGHNVKIGRGCVIVAQVGIAGSSTIEDYCLLAARVGIAGHLTVGQGARIGAVSAVMKDVPAGEEQVGIPAMPAKQYMRQIIALKNLTKRQKSE
ncbi:MAG: UDP-3-O-(3-hydroxymyristoyl)glucosamine N-acyltransferase [Rhodospirillales bacterium]|nr:UDP-3-O-(3-hydroxymyristoyl)glucosamine N-acyltransferase [Alphaproteobacteria bacterium]USO03304.1 MAG: UDP-3-O-(3-hydroxymyristoyl)glucosamine N-acyltransferase [Rhodospirillales bacterium]